MTEVSRVTAQNAEMYRQTEIKKLDKLNKTSKKHQSKTLVTIEEIESDE